VKAFVAKTGISAFCYSRDNASYERIKPMVTNYRLALRLAAVQMLLGGFLISTVTSPSLAAETLKDRCSAEVSIPKTYDGKPGQEGSMLLVRQSGKDWTDWTEPFVVNLGDDGHVRWWCHSTTGNWALKAINKVSGQLCDEAGDSIGGICKKVTGGWVPDPETSEGWTAERSRCGDHSNKFRARLGPSRQLQMVCIGKQ
jgi:hypothetical protein